MSKRLPAQQGVICRVPAGRFRYFAWPTVARMDNGTLLVASSGLRAGHVCPWGKSVLNVSHDDGKTWSSPRVIHDSPIDDRDTGVISLGGDGLLVNWFSSDTRFFAELFKSILGEEELASWRPTLETWTDELVQAHFGSWVMRSEDGGQTWGTPVKIPFWTPHGPVRLRNGKLLYLGKLYYSYKANPTEEEIYAGDIAAALSSDDGTTWKQLGTVPMAVGTETVNYSEPHVVELPSGRLIGIIRIQSFVGRNVDKAGIPSFSMMQTESNDGGQTWTTARPMGFHGSPPHLLRHSSGRLILAYGYRESPFGVRMAFSRDDGTTWDHDWILCDDGPDSDLGYPSTVELADKSLLTVYYQKLVKEEKCSLLGSRWQLP